MEYKKKKRKENDKNKRPRQWEDRHQGVPIQKLNSQPNNWTGPPQPGYQAI